MAKKGKNKKSKKSYKFAFQDQKPENKIPQLSDLQKAIPYHNQKPVFCFKHYQHSDKDFSADKMADIKDFHKFFERIAKMSGLSWGEIERSGNYNAHEITDWSVTTRKSGFNNKVFKDFPGYQFKIFSEFRIVGFFSNAIFHIVWLDRNHKLYS